MRRLRVFLPLVLTAVLAVPLDEPVSRPPNGDLVGLAAATAAARWHCVLPRRKREGTQSVRSPGPAPLEITESRLGEGLPRTEDGRNRAAIERNRLNGFGTGVDQNSRAEITGELTSSDQVDRYLVPIRAGEVFGATVWGAARRLEVYDPAGELAQGSEGDRSVSYPESSPLPGGGNATVDHVAATTGWHVIAVRRGTGTYRVRLEIRQPPADRTQRIVLEFGGARVDTSIFGGEGTGARPRKLSGLREFLPKWGLSESDEAALIERITETVTENLRGESGRGVDRVRVVASNRGQRSSEFGRPNVSRVIIGGTRAQAGIDTIGIAESVDPGNFAREETALVLLDRLSGPSQYPDSLNHYLTRETDRIAFIGQAIGNIVSHEIGHLLGSWHTDPDSGRHDLMAPGDVVGAFGFGKDGVGGTSDDTRSSFDRDSYAPAEGFTGTEDTRNRTTVGLGGGPDPSDG